MSEHRHYIGDAVHADFDGYHIVLTTSDGIRDTNRICLEPSVFEALLNWRQALATMLLKEMTDDQASKESAREETDTEETVENPKP